MAPMGEGAMKPIFDTVAPRICVVDAHAGFIVPQVVASFCVPGSTVQKRATKKYRDEGFE